MTDDDRATRRIEDYLTQLRTGLLTLPTNEVSEIVNELRSHILDRAAPAGGPLTDDAVASALERLGSPSHLASLYAADSVLARAGHGGPWLVLRATLRWAMVSVVGVFAALGLFVGLVISSSFFLAALRKPLAPNRAGLWRLTDGSFSLRLGFGGLEPGRELLGWWIVPLGLLLGAGMVWLTLHLVRLCIRRYRRAPLEAL